MNEVPEDLNWVESRNECSTARLFEQLRLQIEADVQIRNASLAPRQRAEYVFSMASATDRFMVLVSSTFGGGAVASRTFIVNERSIVVRNDQQ